MDINPEILRMFAAAIHEAIFIVREDMTFLFVNDAATDLIGFTKEELSSMQFSQVSSEMNIDQWQVYMERLRGGEKENRFVKFLHKTGENIDVELAAATINFEGQNYVLVIAHDIGKVLIADEKLKTFSRVIEQMPSLVIITDVDGNTEYVNPSFEAITGYKLEEIKGKNPRFLKSGDTPDSVYKNLWETITNGGQWQGELRNIKKDNSSYWALAVISGLKDETGKIVRYVGVQNDITESRNSREILLRRNKEMEKLSKLMIDRELRMAQLKKEIVELKSKLNPDITS